MHEPGNIPQPLTDAQLAEIERETKSLFAFGDTDYHIEHNFQRLLGEVNRLRAENTAIKTQRDQFQKMMNSTVSAGVTVDGERLDALRERDALQGQLDKARALHQPERRYTPDDGETSYATYSEAADASFDGTGTPVSVTFFEVCAHCASIEMAEGCEHDYRESLWPCKDAIALGLGGEGQTNADR